MQEHYDRRIMERFMDSDELDAFDNDYKHYMRGPWEVGEEKVEVTLDELQGLIEKVLLAMRKTGNAK